MIYIYPDRQTDLDSLISVKERGSNVIISYNTNFLVSKFLYYFQGEKCLIFSLDFFELSKYLIDKKEEITPNKAIIPFYVKFGYAPMDYTIIKEIRKLPNLCSLIYDKKNNKVSYELDKPFNFNHKDETFVVKKAISESVDHRRKNVILFSGGADSSLFACLIKDMVKSENIELAIGLYKGLDFLPINLDKEFSDYIAHELRLNLKKIYIDINDISKKQLYSEIIRKQPNTPHFSLLFSAINSYYYNKGEDVNFISGQQVDSILNFGSTSFLKYKNKRIEGLGELVRRLIYLSNPSFLKMFFLLCNWKDANEVLFPQLSLYCGKYKLPFCIDHERYQSLSKLYARFLRTFKEENMHEILINNHLFYSFFHLSGSDASGILNIINFKKTNPLPFNSVNLFNFYASKSHSFADKLMPKKIIYKMLKDYPNVLNIIKNKPNVPNMTYEEIFEKISNNLNLKEEFNQLIKKMNIDNLQFSFNAYHLVKCYEEIYNKEND